MSLFQDIISSLQKKLSAQQQDTQQIALMISEVVGITVLPDQISVRNGVLYLKVQPTIAMSIRLKKELILAMFKEYGIPVTTIG
jgi:hypothetical protein